MPSSQLTIIGCGVFGRAIVEGLSKETRQTYALALTQRRAEVVQQLAADYPNALVTGDNQDPRIWGTAAQSPGRSGRHVVVIGTQPQFTADVCADIRCAAVASQELVVVTLCPGITVAQLENWLPPGTSVIRTMPNTPVAVRQGSTALFPNRHASTAVIAEVQAIFRGLSPVTLVLPHEELMDIVASISGSAPAYFFHLMQSLVTAGTARGLPLALGRELVVQACLGSAVLAQQQESVETLLELLANVCVAGGSTEKAIRTLDHHDATKAIHAAVDASWHANRAMSGEGGNGSSKSQ